MTRSSLAAIAYHLEICHPNVASFRGLLLCLKNRSRAARRPALFLQLFPIPDRVRHLVRQRVSELMSIVEIDFSVAQTATVVTLKNIGADFGLVGRLDFLRNHFRI